MERTTTRTFITGLCCLLICLFIVHDCPGEESPIDVTFEFGYKGVVPRSMRLVPVKVRIANRLRNLSGRIEIRQPTSTNANEVTVVRPFKSPSPSSLTFSLFLRIEPATGIDGYSLQGRVIFDDTSVKTFSKRITAKSDKRLILHSGFVKHYLNNLEKVPAPKTPLKGVYCKHNYQFLNLHPLDFPADPIGFDSVHAVMLNESAFKTFSTKQKQSLAFWLRNGGRLLLYNQTTQLPLKQWLNSLGAHTTA
ncbi:hypothetical protein BVX99_00540, partial [bacterium F16]